jgi:S-(hydroxymethyl)glutathione dehydrogenase / alcohol dehydrogenase
MSKVMRAAVVRERGKPFEIRDDVELIDPRPGEVRVAIRYCGVCGSDLSAWANPTVALDPPFVLGHEAAGEVVDVGAGVTGIDVGQHVVLSFVAPCGHCPQCWAGHSNLCSGNGLAPAGAGLLSVAGQPVGSMSLGGYAEQTVVPASAVVAVDDDVPLDLAALIGCGVMTGVGAVINTARVEPGATVAVLGSGGVGLNVIQGARIAGAAVIVAVDPVEGRRKAALELGATHAADPGDFPGLAAELTRGAGVDYAFEVSGRPESLRPAVLSTRRGGATVLVGLSNAELPVTVREIALAERRILGSFYGSGRTQIDFSRLIALWRAGQLDLARLVTSRIELGEVDAAFAAMRAGEGIRTVIDLGLRPGEDRA